MRAPSYKKRAMASRRFHFRRRGEDLVVGAGALPATATTLSCITSGWLADDGRQFDSSRARRDPLDFALGAGDVIKGWDEGIAGMRVGGKRRLTIPPDLAYGEHGCGGVIPAARDAGVRGRAARSVVAKVCRSRLLSRDDARDEPDELCLDELAVDLLQRVDAFRDLLRPARC